MGKQAVIGVDIGTQGVRAGLFALNGKCLALALRKSRLIRPKPGVVEEDPEYQFSSVCSCIRRCVKDSGLDPVSVGGIAIDGQMAGVIGVNAAGRNVTPYDSWLDTRCAPYIDRMKRRAEDEIIEKTGGPPSFNHGPKMLWWKHEHPGVFADIRAFVQPGGYAAMRLAGLTGSEAFIDRTYLHFSGFADNRGEHWDADLCRRFGMPRAKLPVIVSSHEQIGELTSPMARRCGLGPGVPVIAGCGDTAASFLAVGAVREGICVDVAGTASVFAATTRQFVADRTDRILSCAQAVIPGLHHPYAYINGGGMNLEWFRTAIAAGATFRDLERSAADPGPDDPMFVPHLAGRVSPSQPLLRGAWANLTWSHSAADLYRAVLEGVALEYALYKEVLCARIPTLRLREVRVTGGGERSALWNQIKADALGVRVIRVRRTEGAPLGSALLAAYGAGLVKNLSRTASEWIKTGTVVEPRARLSSHYRDRLRRYKHLLAALDEWGPGDGRKGK